MLHQQRFTASYDYPVYFGMDVFSPGNTTLADVLSRREPGRRHRVAFVVEERVLEAWPALARDIERYAEHHSRRMELAAPPRVVRGGEECKNDANAPGLVAAWFEALRLDRQSFVVIVGGGALQDMVGYAAATTHRGLRVVRVPTTVLAQNDSGVGVKNGVNAFDKKNFFGVFAPPFAVLDDFRFLETLERRDQVSGMAEAVKVALIKDLPFFEWLERSAERLARFEPAEVAELVQRCAVLHLNHIAGGGDPFELGSSRPLDFGHWAAHKLEALSSYALRHGEAVAIGIALDTRYSVEAGLLGEADSDRVLALLEQIGLPTWSPWLEVRAAGGRRLVLDGILEFREHLGGDLTVMMLGALGSGVEIRELDLGLVDRALEWLGRRAEGGSVTAAAARSRLSAGDAAESTGP